jgi:hypothetical protein
MLRMESANQEIDGRPLPPLGEDARPKYRMGFGKEIPFQHIINHILMWHASRHTERLGRRQSRSVQGKPFSLH